MVGSPASALWADLDEEGAYLSAYVGMAELSCGPAPAWTTVAGGRILVDRGEPRLDGLADALRGHERIARRMQGRAQAAGGRWQVVGGRWRVAAGAWLMAGRADAPG